jgi:tRNA threonylcarbamoyladenosine biosynthesis protein TsaE
MEIITNSTQETEQFGQELSHKLASGDILLLSGNLGAGKTALVKGIALGFNIKNEITSPTFTLMNLYEIKNNDKKIKTLVHIDTYRLNHEKDLIEIGVEDYLGKPGIISVIEWPEKIEGLLKNTDKTKTKIISISIEQLPEVNQRKILIS